MELFTIFRPATSDLSRLLLPKRDHQSSPVSRNKRSRLFRVLNAASGAVSASPKKLIPLEKRGKSALNGSSSSALEQLDIERGVCIPFRKYTPQMVIIHFFFPRKTLLYLYDNLLHC
jgi:hypothetical protein